MAFTDLGGMNRMGKGFTKEDSLALKGLAIILMALSHSYRTFSKFENHNLIFCGISPEQLVATAHYGKICVAFFAFVSGFGLMYSYSRILQKKSTQTPSKWIGQHLLSTMAGYWFVVPLSYLAYGIGSGFNFSRWGATYSEKILRGLIDFFGLSELLTSVTLNGSWWYMSAAISFIILVPFLAVMMEKFGSFGVMALVFILPRCLGLPYQGGNSVLAFLMTMTFGMVCCKHNILEKIADFRLLKNRQAAQALRCVILIALIIFGYLTYPIVKQKIVWEYDFVVTPFIAIIFCVEFLFKVPVISDVLRFLGKHSLNLWLIHTFARDWLNDIVYGVRVVWLVPLVMIALSIPACYAIDALKKVTGYDRMVQRVLVKFK